MGREVLLAVALLGAGPVLAQEKTQDFGGAKPNGPDGWFRRDDYPATARRESRQGLVRFAFSINAQGRVEDCRITLSSGSADLDATACRLLAMRGRFKVPTPPDGVFHTIVGHSQIVWRL